MLSSLLVLSLKLILSLSFPFHELLLATVPQPHPVSKPHQSEDRTRPKITPLFGLNPNGNGGL